MFLLYTLYFCTIRYITNQLYFKTYKYSRQNREALKNTPAQIAATDFV